MDKRNSYAHRRRTSMIGIVAAVLIGLSLLVAVAAVASVVFPPDCPAPKRPVSEVTSFNDGFTDAKRDDCERGFQPACRWLEETGAR